MTAQELAAAVRRRQLTRLRRGSYAPTATVDTLDEVGRHLLRCKAVLARLGSDSVLSHQSGALAWGLQVYEVDLSLVHVSRPARSSGRVDADVDHHDAHVPEHRRAMAYGLPCADAAHCTIDVSRMHTFESGLVTADSALARGVPSTDLLAALEECRSWPGAARASRVVAYADGRAESVGESLTRCACIREGLPAPVPQFVIVLPDGTARADLAWPKRSPVSAVGPAST